MQNQIMPVYLWNILEDMQQLKGPVKVSNLPENTRFHEVN